MSRDGHDAIAFLPKALKFAVSLRYVNPTIGVELHQIPGKTGLESENSIVWSVSPTEDEALLSTLTGPVDCVKDQCIAWTGFLRIGMGSSQIGIDIIGVM